MSAGHLDAKDTMLMYCNLRHNTITSLQPYNVCITWLCVYLGNDHLAKLSSPSAYNTGKSFHCYQLLQETGKRSVGSFKFAGSKI
jgi:hypothetical protein